MVLPGVAGRLPKVLSSDQDAGKEVKTVVGDRKRVVIADDQYVARGFFEMYVKMSVDFELAASLATAEQAVEYCRKEGVDYKVEYFANVNKGKATLVITGLGDSGTGTTKYYGSKKVSFKIGKGVFNWL